MVRDRVTDGFRVAELLASEVDGRQRGPLGPLVVANADRSVTGTPAGERAYEIRFLEGDRDPRREPTPDDAGTLVAEVLVHESGASLAVAAGADAAADTASDEGLSVSRVSDAGTAESDAKEAESEVEIAEIDADADVVIAVEYGAQAKRAADALAAASEAVDAE